MLLINDKRHAQSLDETESNCKTIILHQNLLNHPMYIFNDHVAVNKHSLPFHTLKTIEYDH